MTSQLSPTPIFKAFDNNGFPLAFGLLTTYQAGTLTKQATYVDSTQTTQNTNPIQLNFRGECAIWLDPTLTYKFALTDQFGNTIPGWPVDNIPGGFGSGPFSVNLIPNPTNTFTLGSPTNSWAQIYLGANAAPAYDPVSGNIAYYARTAAEIAAGVTPTNYAYAPGDVRRYGADPTGVADSTTALQNCANGCGGVMTYPQGATFLVSGQITTPANTVMYGNGSTINAPTTGFHVFVCKGATIIEKLNFTRNAAAQNTSWKAVNADNFLNAMPANTRVIVRDCMITNFDIGVYCDGGASQNIIYAEVSGCRVVINTSGTGGLSSVRPTVNLNNCAVAVIRDNPLLDASDRVNDVNNIYCIGSSKVTISNNYLFSGVTKVVSSASNSVFQATIDRNRFLGIPWILVGADTNPVRAVEITDNYFDTPVTQAVDVGCILLGSYTSAVVTGDSIESIVVKGNYIRNAPCSVYYISLTAGNSLGCVNLTGNRYQNASASSAGTYPVVNYNAVGSTYRLLQCANEDVFGSSNTRTYLGGSNPFSTVLATQINEVGITSARSGILSGTFTATLTGCTTAPTATVNYTIRDSIAVLNLPSLTATSNSTSCTLTGLPAILQPLTQTSNVPVAISDSGTYSLNAAMSIAPGSGTMTLSKAGSTTGFTASGAKGIFASTITIPLV